MDLLFPFVIAVGSLVMILFELIASKKNLLILLAEFFHGISNFFYVANRKLDGLKKFWDGL